MGDAKQNGTINGVAMEEEREKNPETVRLLDLEDDDTSTISSPNRSSETLFTILNRFVAAILSPDPKTSGAETPLFQRIKNSVCENVPLLPEASRNSARNLLIWTRQGSSLRALLVISVGTIVLLALTGLLVFMLFFVAATINAIIISLLMSLAAAGGFLAIFFACMTAIYIGALSVAVFVISSATITTIFAVMVATDLSTGYLEDAVEDWINGCKRRRVLSSDSEQEVGLFSKKQNCCSSDSKRYSEYSGCLRQKSLSPGEQDDGPKKVAYPFEMVKPGGIKGDETLNEINERIMKRPKRPVRHPVGEFVCNPCVLTTGFSLSGKAVVAITRIHTQGRGTVTIIRTRG